jgi:cellulose synthase/poly-beta-1,6-N-acetylglucosamine synthase-like glycosyltransferase
VLKPNVYDIFLLSAAFNAAQLLTTFLFQRRLRRQLAEPPGSYAPSVTVIVACKGDPPDFAGNISSLLDQDYPGARRYLLALPSREDPAHRRLETLLSGRGRRRVRLCASESLPSCSSGKALDLLFALRQAPPETELLLFADADIRVHRAWIAQMVSPLQDERVGASTTALLAVPRQGGFWSFLRFVWLGVSVSNWSFMGAVCGQSLAMRRREFYALQVPELWEHALLEDLALSARLRRWSKEVRFVARAMPVTVGGCDAGQYFDVSNRWIKCCRIFDAGVWLMGLAYLAVKIGVTLWTVLHRDWFLLAFFWSLDMLNVFLLFESYRRLLPDRFRDLPLGGGTLSTLAAIASPLLAASYLTNFLTSLMGNSVVWGRYVYRVGRGKELAVSRR